MTDLLKQQEQLEDRLRTEGIQRFRRRLERARQDREASMEGAARKSLGDSLLAVLPVIEEWLEHSKTAKGRKHYAYRWLSALGAEKSAYLVTRVVLDHIYDEVQSRKLALKLAGMVLDELRFRKLEKEAPGLFKYKLDKFSTSHYGYKKAVLMQACRWAEVDVSEFEIAERHRLHIGSKLLDLFISATGLVEHVTIAKKQASRWHRTNLVRATPETLEWLRKRNDWLEDMTPTHTPLVVPPLPWGETEPIPCPECQGRAVECGVFGEQVGCSFCNGCGAVGETTKPGGYLFALKGTVDQVRSNSKRIREQIEESLGPLTHAALNRLQDTAWAVNKRVLEVVKEALEAGGEVAGLPGIENEPLPAKPHDIDENEDARRAWRREAAQVHERNRSETGQRFEALKAVALAEEYSDYEAFFYVWNLDFRGRCYPVADILQPQGADVARGLLTFADGVSLGPDGGWWLMLHGANCLGEYEGEKVSHLTLEERVELIDGLARRIATAAQDPWADTFWQDADDPWQFLAFCFEYDAWARGGFSDSFISRLVCHVDGTANGLQHFSALLRDEDGADVVNMTVRQEPSDIYQRVANVVKQLLVHESDPEGKVYADLWLTGPVPIDRKLVKRPTMTSAYGSGRFGFADQILAYIRTERGVEDWRATRKHFVVDEKEVYAGACRYMAHKVWDALGCVVSGAFGAMDWLQAGARGFTKVHKLTEWTVPISGMRVIQPYVEYDAVEVETVIAGQLWKPRAYQPVLNRPVAHEQANGVSPNFIHSLDAVALQLTVVRSCSQGACAFAAIHDSFGAHAGHMAQVSHTLRVAFVDLHTLPILENLKAEWESHGLQLDDLPQPGRFKIDEVLAADYFFC